MKRIPLRARDGSVRAYALVDDEDYEWVSAFTWSLHSAGYAYRQTGAATGRRNVLLHRSILGLVAGDPRQGDHVNRERLDCRRENLRITTRVGNAQNVVAQVGSRSRFRGVSWDARRGKWRAKIRNSWVGSFYDTELDAARAVDAARAELMPFALPDPELARAVAGASG